MVAKKRSGKSKKLSTSSAMSNILNRQKKSTKAIEIMMEKNIAAEISARRPGKPKEKPLSGIAVDVAARHRAKSAPKKKTASARKKAHKPAIKKVRRPVLSKKPVSTNRPASRKPAAKTRRDKRTSIEIITLGAGLFKVVGVAVGGLFYAGRSLTGFVSSGVAKATKSLGSGAKSAKERVKGAVKSVKRGARVKPKRKMADEKGAVAAAMKTAGKVTGKVAGGMMTVGSGAGKAAGYVVTGALAAPVDFVNGVIGIGASATGSVSRLLFGPHKSKRSKTEKRRRIPVT